MCPAAHKAHFQQVLQAAETAWQDAERVFSWKRKLFTSPAIMIKTFLLACREGTDTVCFQGRNISEKHAENYYQLSQVFVVCLWQTVIRLEVMHLGAKRSGYKRKKDDHGAAYSSKLG